MEQMDIKVGYVYIKENNMKRMTRKQYIEKLEEYQRELYDMDEFTIDEYKNKVNLYTKTTSKTEIFIAGMEAGLLMAISLLEDL